MSKKIIINDLTALENWVTEWLENLPKKEEKNQATVLALSGELGAGKTTLVQHLARALKVAEVVTSPTFTIMKSYKTNGRFNFQNLVHIDAYKIDSLDEIGPLRLAEILNDSKTLVCIEWAEKIVEILPQKRIEISLNALKDGARELIIKP